MNPIATPIPSKRGDRPLPLFVAVLLSLAPWAVIGSLILFAVRSCGS